MAAMLAKNNYKNSIASLMEKTGLRGDTNTAFYVDGMVGDTQQMMNCYLQILNRQYFKDDDEFTQN